MIKKPYRVVNVLSALEWNEEDLTEEDIAKIELLNTLNHKVCRTLIDEDDEECYGIIVPLFSEPTWCRKRGEL